MNNERLSEYLRRGPLIAAHRGVAAGNIPFNTIPAFDAALAQGADILETDVIKSADGTVFIFHIHQEINHLNRDIELTRMTAKEIREVRYVNFDRNETAHGLPTLDEFLERYKGRCLINLDHIWECCFKETIETVRRHKMEDMVLIKTPPKPVYLQMVAELAPDIPYFSIIKERDEVSDLIRSMNINYAGAELVFRSEDSPCVSAESLRRYADLGLALWGNAILYNYKTELSGGHTDDRAVTGDPEGGWGYFLDRGFDIVQTDWPLVMKQYLRDRETGHIKYLERVAQ